MCTVGVSLYSNTASHPLSRLHPHLPCGGAYITCFRPSQRPVSVNLVEEQADCGRRRPGAGAVDHVERVAGARQLHVADHRVRRRAQPLDEAAGLLDGDDAVAGAVDDQERWRILVDPRDRRGLTEDVRVPGDLAPDHDALEEVDEPRPLNRRAVLPVVAAVDADHRVDRSIRAVGQFALHLRVVGGQACQRRQVSTRRTTRYRNEIAVAAELVDVGAGPGDRGLDVGDVRPASDGAARPGSRWTGRPSPTRPGATSARSPAAGGCRAPRRRRARRSAPARARRADPCGARRRAAELGRGP